MIRMSAGHTLKLALHPLILLINACCYAITTGLLSLNLIANHCIHTMDNITYKSLNHHPVK